MPAGSRLAEGPDGLVYQSRLQLSSATLNLVADLIRGHLKTIRSRWRKLPPGKIALIVLALTDDKGNLIWILAARPGRASEITTARHDRLTAWLREAGLGAIGDLGFVGLDDNPDNPVIITGRRRTGKHPLTDTQREANRLVSRERAVNEHGFAYLKNWRILTKVRMNLRHATTLLRALLVLTRLEVTR